MRAVFKLFFWVAGSFLALLLLFVGAGLALPKEHKVTRHLHLKASPDKVWKLVTHHAQDPLWRKDVMATTRIGDRNGHPVWQDEFQNGQVMAYETTEQVEGQRLVRTIVDQKLFGGTWTYELKPEGSGTHLSLTEDGWVSIPFRAAARFIFGHASTVEAYLTDVARRFNESAKPQA